MGNDQSDSHLHHPGQCIQDGGEMVEEYDDKTDVLMVRKSWTYVEYC